jgi:hypothetical protein
MRSISVLCVSFVLFACGGSGANAPASPTGGTATAATESGPCTAAFAKERPAGWVDSGKLVIQMKEDMPTGFELADVAGKKVDSGPISEKSARKAIDVLMEKACKVGGVLVVYDATADGPMTASIVKPAHEDEAADLAALCKMPSSVAADLDDAQKRRVAQEAYEGSLSSRKWRGWLFDMTNKARKEEGDAARGAIRKVKADELDGAAKTKDCWFATTLRK